MSRLPRAVLAGLVWLTLPAATLAHRLDEYLQATRIGIARDRIDLEIDLTPGVAVAAPIIDAIDRDRDGVASESETNAYAAQVVDGLSLNVDGRRLAIVLTGASIPRFSELREGLGAIRLTATTRLPAGAPGRHELRFRNGHRPEASVYLANALVPRDAAVVISAQHRDGQQRELRIDYEIASHPSAGLWPPLTAGAAATLAAGLVWRRRRRTPGRLAPLMRVANRSHAQRTL